MQKLTPVSLHIDPKNVSHHAFKHIWPLLVEHGAEALRLPQVCEHRLSLVYEPLLRAGSSGTHVVAQVGQSLDGRIATPTGASRDINGFAGLDHLHRVRALVDAVVVGVGTILVDDPQLTTRRVPGPSPARVVVDPRGRSSKCARWTAYDGGRCLVFSDAGGWPDHVERVASPAGDGDFPVRMLLRELAHRGMRKILVEGGSHTISRFIDAGLVDRLHVCVAPVILGSGRPSLALRPIDKLTEAMRPLVQTHRLEDGNILFDCDLRSRQGGGSDGDD